MSAAQALYAENVAGVSTSSTVAWSDCAEIAAASFTASKKYLVVAIAFLESSSASNEVQCRLVHGPDGSEVEFTDGQGVKDVMGGGNGIVYSWMRVFDQPGTTEQIKLQIKAFAAATVQCHYSAIFCLKLSDDFTENTDWYYNEVTVDDTSVATTYEDGASVTIVGNSTDTWLVLGDIVRITPSTTADEFFRLNLDGSLEPEGNIEGDDTTNDRNQYLLSRAYVPDSSSVAKIQYRNESGAVGTVLSTRVFAINLAKFDQFFNEYTSAATGSIQTNFVTVATESVTPNVTGDWFYIGGFGHDAVGTTDNLNIRLQDDNDGSMGSDPAYGDDEPGVWCGDGTNFGWFPIMKMKSLTSGGSRTINLDARDTVAASVARHRSLVGFSLELAAGDISMTLTPVTMTDTAQTLSKTQQAISVSLTPASETNAAQSLGSTVGPAIEKALTAALETDTAQTLTFSISSGDIEVSITPVTETDAAQPVAFSQQAISVTITPATEAEAAQGLAFSQAAISVTITPATEIDQAVALSIEGAIEAVLRMRTLTGMGQ